MARIKLLEENAAEGKIKEAYDNLQKDMGFVPNVMKLVARREELFRPWMRYIQALMFSPSDLPQDMKEKIASVVSGTNRCDYCVRHHVNFQKMYGVSDATAKRVARNYQQADIPDSEKALLSYAVQVARDATRVTDGDVENLRKNGYSEEQILEATLVVAQFSGKNRLIDALGLEFEPRIAFE